MGLLGGFKAKLIGKPKKTKTQVVCTKFKTFSEFEPNENALPSCSNVNLGKNEVVKERRRPTKPEITGIFQPVNGDIKKPPEENIIPITETSATNEKKEAPKPPPRTLAPQRPAPEPTLPSADEEDDGNFKIHVVQNQQTHSDQSESSSESEEELAPFDYSSQATSIFFGEAEEPRLQRPRHFVLDDDDDENASDASA